MRKLVKMIGVQEPQNRVSVVKLLKARAKLPKQRRSVLPVEQPRRKKMENATNRRMNAIKHPPAVFKDAFGAAKIGNVNGVNVIGLALQGPSMPSIAVLHHNGPYNIDTPPEAPGLIAMPLQPRPATTGSVDVLPLQPKYLPTFDREYRSEPRDIPPKHQEESEHACRYLSDPNQVKMTEAEIGLASVPAMAIGSSTEVLVSIVENQVRLRRNSSYQARSPDMENVKSPSTEFTSTVESTPVEEGGGGVLDSNDNEKNCDSNLCDELNKYTV
ncbi:hypothetical protein NQ315_000370 [Exocentrus adspersus]|uniref:Uncharacterized protein n=1 Tax=Exocentrus adspersus TaxID=1586481 RepID=A0AAV8VLL0_9CUCU|nr:hypothetical protein NQ315_000370 [Exocentrus adspersus]